ncbi:MAG TPA: DUF5134 domain-containing protein [Trebonia sp.]
MSPVWLLDAFAALMLAVAAVSAARLVAARPRRRGVVTVDSDGAHLLMAIAMAGMLAPGLRTLPDRAWEVIFGLLAVWFVVRVARDARANGVRALAGGHCAPHLVHSCSMVYMFAAMTTAAGAAGMSDMGGMPGDVGSAMMTLRYPLLALVFAFVLAGYSIWDLDQVSGRRYRLEAPRVSLAGVAPGVGVPALAAASGRPGTVGAASEGVAVADVAIEAEGVPATPGAGWAAGGGEAAGERVTAGVSDRAGAGSRAFLLSPAVTIGCRVAMGVAMAFMLIIAI